MKKNVSTASIDVDVQIKKMLLDKIPMRDIVKALSTSTGRICKVKKAMLGNDTIRKERVTDIIRNKNRNVEAKRNTADTTDETIVESTRKRVELKALEAMEQCLDDGDITVKDATSILSVVGEKPKQQGDTVVMLINSVGNMAVAARQLLINEARNKQAESIVQVQPTSDVIDIENEKPLE